MDARHETRYEVEGQAEVFVGSSGFESSLLRGQILDISTSGCYIRTLAQIAIRREVPVHIEFSVYGQLFRVRAASRFSRTKVGAGFTFIDMDAATRDRLNGFVAAIRSDVVAESADGSRQKTRLKAG